jgi:hypothetical protein
MRRSSKPLPEDISERAAEIARLSTEGPPKAVSDYLAEIGRKGGLKGGKARAQALPANKRKAIAQKAAAVRWSKKRV